MSKITSLTKYELTQLYYPGCSKRKTGYFFEREIHANKHMLEELRRVGYAKFRKVLSSTMVKIIFKYLTDPRDDE
jgi:hypothetical protein